MKLRSNPLAAFERDGSPIAIHVRRKWLGGNGADSAAAGRIVEQFARSQKPDGSWQNSTARTIENLFALWLIDKPSAMTARAIDWLLEAHRAPLRYTCGDGGCYDNFMFHVGRADIGTLAGVPFTQGCSGFVKTGAALFLASAMGQGDAARIDAAFKTLAALSRSRDGRVCSGPCANNMIQAMAMHPKHSRSPAMRLMIQSLANRQNPNGTWSTSIPFYPTLYALSRVGKPASAQLERAIDRLIKTQNRDGTWGRSQSLLNTFLVVDALDRLDAGFVRA